MNLTLTIALGLGSSLISYFVVPPDLQLFDLVAAVGIMGGYQIGRLLRGKVTRSLSKILIIIPCLLVFLATAIAYAIRIQMGSANTSDIVLLGVILFVCFSSLGLWLPLAGLAFAKEPWSYAMEAIRAFRGNRD